MSAYGEPDMYGSGRPIGGGNLYGSGRPMAGNMYGSNRSATMQASPTQMMSGYAQSPQSYQSPGLVYNRSPAYSEGYVQEGYQYGGQYGNQWGGMREVREMQMVPQQVTNVVMVPREVRRMVPSPPPVYHAPPPVHYQPPPIQYEPYYEMPAPPQMLARDEEDEFIPMKAKAAVQRSAPRPVTPESEEEFIQKTVTKAQRSAKAPAEKIIEKIVEVEKIIEVEVPKEYITYVDRPYEVENIITKTIEVAVPVERIVEVEVMYEKVVTVEVPVETIIYKDVPVPVQMSNERVVVREIPVPVEIIKEVQVPVERVVYKEVLVPTEGYVNRTSPTRVIGEAYTTSPYLTPDHRKEYENAMSMPVQQIRR
eukprot:CAMPEP_0179435426 /NCGR_PEP_ID=MMETSP0799-20121207/19541_1 /TAXON_ID=46947 /ORGANISM="Geminigera cryophila, Strain CCMP2564" /LENGTH=365 /DNA_ID=CAMNT_0021214795 /DNA_START=17 /DNA_END=1114 /DNA_ORIENTATION=+